MEPTHAADPALLKTLNELISREPIFHRIEHLEGRTPTRADFESMTDPAFFEIGASGSIYTRSQVLDILEARHNDPTYRDDPWSTSGFQLRQLSPDTYLLTYILIQHQSTCDRTTRRTAIWRATPSGWKIVFHQGTVVLR